MASTKLVGERSRIIGLETEFGIRATGNITGDEIRMAITRQKPGYWCNAGLLYRDVGNAECSTSESQSGRQVVARKRVLEKVLEARINNAYTQKQRTNIRLLKNNIGRSLRHGVYVETSHGSHENYLRRLSVGGRPPQSNVAVVGELSPFLVTRQIFAGAGSVVVDEVTGQWHYEISQRGRHIKELFFSSAVFQRGFIKSGNNPYADKDIYCRFELIIGDSNILFDPEAYKIDITSLMLLMQENQALPRIRLQNPVLAIQAVARQGLDAIIRLEFGQEVSPVWIQRQYYLAARQFIQLHGLDEFKPALSYWSDCLKAFESGQLQRLIGRVDWVTKMYLLFKTWLKLQTRRLEKEGGSTTGLTANEAFAVDISYHALTGTNARAAAIRQAYDPPGLEQEIQAAAKIIAPGRPHLRARILELAKQYQAAYVDLRWSMVTIDTGHDKRAFEILDPYGNDEEVLRHIESFLAHSVHRAA